MLEYFIFTFEKPLITTVSTIQKNSILSAKEIGTWIYP